MIADRQLAHAGSLALPGVPGGHYDLDIDIHQNALVVIIEEASPAAIATFKALYGEDVIVEQGELAAPESCTREDCRYTLRSGLRTTRPNLSPCSTAFVVRRPDGTRNILSAAHCGGVGVNDVNEGRLHGGEQYGHVVAQQLGGRVDAERHNKSNPFRTRAWIYVNDQNKEVEVHDISTWSSLNVGTHACVTGAFSQNPTSCGSIKSKDFSPNPDAVPNGERFIRANYCAADGDSGGGVYRKDDWGKVHGIHSGGGEADCGFRPDLDWSYFGHIEYALNALNVSLVTASDDTSWPDPEPPPPPSPSPSPTPSPSSSPKCPPWDPNCGLELPP